MLSQVAVQTLRLSFVFSFVLISIELDTDNESAVDAHMVVVKVDI